MTCQDDSLLRTIESYERDVLINDISVTGIKEKCVFHSLNDFHVTTNFAVDIMHDLLEGVCNYDLTTLLNALIFDYEFF